MSLEEPLQDRYVETCDNLDPPMIGAKKSSNFDRPTKRQRIIIEISDDTDDAPTHADIKHCALALQELSQRIVIFNP